MPSSVPARTRDQARDKQSTLGELISSVLTFAATLLLALLTSIAIEWGGMLFNYWPADGSHARDMLAREITFLSEDFQLSVAGSAPATIGVDVANRTHETLFVESGAKDLFAFLAIPASVRDSTVIQYARNAYLATREYLLSVFAIIQLFMVRLAMIGLSVPLMLLVAFVAAVDGLVQRELRKAGNGKEYALVYHKVKSWFKPALFAPAFIYLAIPVPTHPNWVFVPSAAMIGILVYILTATFKKQL